MWGIEVDYVWGVSGRKRMKELGMMVVGDGMMDII